MGICVLRREAGDVSLSVWSLWNASPLQVAWSAQGTTDSYGEVT